MILELDEVSFLLDESEDSAQTFGKLNEGNAVFALDSAIFIIQNLEEGSLDKNHLMTHIVFFFDQLVALIHKEDEVSVAMLEGLLQCFELDAMNALSVEDSLKLLDTLSPYSHVVGQATVETVDQVLFRLPILLELDADEAFVKKKFLLKDVHRHWVSAFTHVLLHALPLELFLSHDCQRMVRVVDLVDKVLSDLKDLPSSQESICLFVGV